MNLQKLMSLREGQRSLIESQLEQLQSAKEQGDSFEFELILTSIDEILLAMKELDESVLNQTGADQIAAEVTETGAYNLKLKIKIEKEKKFYNRAVVERDGSGSGDVNQSSMPQISGQEEQHTSVQIPLATQSFHKLPKLSLPTFNGDILLWQTFWDSFEASVHNNNSLSDVQKFSYLKSLLEDDASRTISGLALTNSNYSQALDLLKERYGQKHMITAAHMQTLLQLPTPSLNICELREFYDQLETNIRGLESLGEAQDTYGNLLIPVILERLPAETRRNLARDHGTGSWSLPDLRKAILREIDIMDAGENRQKCVPEYRQTASFFAGARKSESVVKNRTEFTDNKCIFCDKIHSGFCKQISDVNQRIAIVKRKHLCFNCLSSKHQVFKCGSRGRCRKCKGKHHTSICQRSQTQVKGTGESVQASSGVTWRNSHSSANAEDGAAILHSATKTSRPEVLLKTAVATVCADNKYAQANVLMDEGAQRSFVSQKLADKLQLKRDGTELMNLSAFGDPAQRTQHLDTATVNVVADNGDFIPIRVLIVPIIARPLGNTYLGAVKELTYLTGLKLAHPVTMETTFEISLLVGADFYWQIVGDKTIRGNGPTAVSSRIGYFLSGPLPSQTTSVIASSVIVMDVIATCVPDETDLTQFWDLESMGVSAEDHKEADASQYLKNYKETCISYADGKYTARLPWKPNHQPLPTNYSITKKRTENTIQRLCREPVMFKKYGDIIQEQERRNFIEKVECSMSEKNDVHYIPHHGVKKDSTTTPVRIVYDCSCRESSESPSLNDCLESTPPELNDLTTLLMRFRLGIYGVSTDIEKAFLHVGLHEDDRDFTRFLWLTDPDNPDSQLMTYRFKSVPFGATCSPFILNATILKHLALNESNPATDVITRDLYVDNVISSFDQETVLVNYFRSARELMSTAGFNLRSWSSNSEKLCETARSESVLDATSIVKLLGMLWNPKEDKMSFVIRTIPEADTITKRSILQQTSRIYDPLGMLGPVTVRAKLFVQDLWKQKFTWDACLPTHIVSLWSAVITDLNVAMTTSFPRRYTSKTYDPDTAILHVFVDASTRAYGAVAYLTFGGSSSFLYAKNRVAPVKEITLPRLELMAALIGARIVQHVTRAIGCKNVICWSDSQIVLHWLRSTKTLKRFVLNRVEEIKRLTCDAEWRFCPTNENPADLQTRGITAEQLHDSTLWRFGPEWLYSKEFPRWEPPVTSALMTVADQEAEVDPLPDTTSGPDLRYFVDVTRYSTYRKLLRVTAYVLRFIANVKTKIQAHRNTGPLTSEEFKMAENQLIRSCQQQKYRNVIDDLESIHRRHPIVRQLRLYLDENGCIRCGGRIHNAPIPDSARFPYLLPPHDDFTRLIIRDAHSNQLHAGVAQTVTHLRQKFWIPSIRQNVKTVLRHCVTCRKATGKPYTSPEQPPLPAPRVSDDPPFSVTGVDFTGALYVKQKHGQPQKVYICLFTCASTRAVHLELVPDLKEESFLLAFRRFVSRRSLPKMMISDNATTYQAAAIQIHRLCSSTTVQSDLNQRGTQWKFIPTRAPWYGGWWERLIGITKLTLKKILGRACIDLMTLQTVLTEVEAIMNDRPLTYVSTSCSDPEPLTPSHLLNGRRLTALPFSDVTIDSVPVTSRDTVTTRAKNHAHVVQQYWKRWKHEYLTALREYHRSSGTRKQTIRNGDVVQIQDDFTNRSRWTLGVIDNLVTGHDGMTRAAIVRTSKGRTTLPIVKLYPLEIIRDY